MKKLYKYTEFILENKLSENKIFENEEMVEIFNDADILESIVTEYDSLLKTINAEEVNIYDILKLDKDKYSKFINIDGLYDDDDFNKSLTKHKLRKSQMEITDECETFLENVLDVKFFLIHNVNKNYLENPDYIIFQTKNKNSARWKEIKAYKVQDDIKKFYDKLTNKTIELKRGDKSYIYFTSNSGNDWQLKNIENKDDQFKDYLNNDEIKVILKSKDCSITIVN